MNNFIIENALICAKGLQDQKHEIKKGVFIHYDSLHKTYTIDMTNGKYDNPNKFIITKRAQEAKQWFLNSLL